MKFTLVLHTLQCQEDYSAKRNTKFLDNVEEYNHEFEVRKNS